MILVCLSVCLSLSPLSLSLSIYIYIYTIYIYIYIYIQGHLVFGLLPLGKGYVVHSTASKCLYEYIIPFLVLFRYFYTYGGVKKETNMKFAYKNTLQTGAWEKLNNKRKQLKHPYTLKIINKYRIVKPTEKAPTDLPQLIGKSAQYTY